MGLSLFDFSTIFFMSAITVSSLSLAIQEVVIPWLVAHHIFDVTVDQYVQSTKLISRVIHAIILLFITFFILFLYKENQKLKFEKSFVCSRLLIVEKMANSCRVDIYVF